VSDADAVAEAVAAAEEDAEGLLETLALGDGDCVPLPVREPLRLPLPEPVMLCVAVTEAEGNMDAEPDGDCVPLLLQLAVALADSVAVADDEPVALPLKLGVPVRLLDGLLLRVAPELPDTVLLADCVADEVCAEGRGRVRRGDPLLTRRLAKGKVAWEAPQTQRWRFPLPTRQPAAAVPR